MLSHFYFIFLPQSQQLVVRVSCGGGHMFAQFCMPLIRSGHEWQQEPCAVYLLSNSCLRRQTHAAAVYRPCDSQLLLRHNSGVPHLQVLANSMGGWGDATMVCLENTKNAYVTAARNEEMEASAVNRGSCVNQTSPLPLSGMFRKPSGRLISEVQQECRWPDQP